jgi:hypothetical protein
MLQSIFADSRSKHRPLGKDDPTSRRQATSDAETPPFNTLNFPPDAETPPFNTFDFSLLPKHHCQQSVPFPSLLKHHYHQTHTFSPIMFNNLLPLFPISSPSFIDETTPSNNCFAFSFLLLKHHCQQLFIIFPDAETPLFNTFDFLPMLKHHCSTLFAPPIAKTLQFANSSHFLQHRPTIVSPFLFLLLKHHCQQLFIIFPDAETPLFSTFDFLPMLKHHCSTLFVPSIPKHHKFCPVFLLLKQFLTFFINETTPSNNCFVLFCC